MTELIISLPQMGEGLQEARILARLRGRETIRRDEPLFQMETDKAVVEIESTYTGIVHRWLCEEGDMVAIGAPVVSISTSTDPSVEGSELLTAH